MVTFNKKALNIRTDGKRIARIDITLVVQNATGEVYFTDIMFQGGTLATLWTGAPAELEWSFNA